jgi:hypothetical protein
MARYKLVNGVRIKFTAEEETIRDTEEAQEAIKQTAYATLKYQRDRKKEYPAMADQLDMQYWDQVNGTTTWKDAISKVKTDNPKE